MNTKKLRGAAKMLVADNKGLLAIDASTPTCNKRFAGLGIPRTPEARRNWRKLLVTTPRFSECINGIILFDETIRQWKKGGTSFVQAILEAGAIDMAGHPGETIIEGLDGLRAPLAEYAQIQF